MRYVGTQRPPHFGPIKETPEIRGDKTYTMTIRL